MRIGIANDHHGIELKKRIIDYLTRNGIEYKNYGCDSTENSENIDYVDYAIKLCDGIIIPGGIKRFEYNVVI